MNIGICTDTILHTVTILVHITISTVHSYERRQHTYINLHRVQCTCTMKDMSIGSIERGKRRMLKRERATNALSAVRRLLGSSESLFTRIKVANVAKATWQGNNVQHQPSVIE